MFDRFLNIEIVFEVGSMWYRIKELSKIWYIRAHVWFTEEIANGWTGPETPN